MGMQIVTSGTSGMDFAALVGRAVAGNKAAQRSVCERQLPLFQRVAARLTFRFRNVTRETARQEQMDIMQHIVLAFMEELQNRSGVVARWRPEQGPLEAWLRPFATCRGLDYLRKRKDGRHLSIESMLGAIESDLQELHAALPRSIVQVEHREVLARLCELILKDPALGPEMLKLLERIFWDDEDREVVAQSLGIKRNTLDQKIKRGRAALSKLAKSLGLSQPCS